MSDLTMPQAIVWAAVALACGWAVNSVTGCAQNMKGRNDVEIECAKQHGSMASGDCTFPNEVKK
ncbi:hypothetical protein [Hyphomicrobium sp.]|uniref:hypothetical protein n=1 Tax=Hyphomicrobium sp. TaxID=82 RepID=UPI001E0402A3|nr:hypothetical protein [Hyphomicrobium sp.]MBY0559914.1 hypothetical protein [Hyphomicrobium sp.]